MDLREALSPVEIRHPWETSRLAAIRKILKGEIKGGLSVLDIGCGDGFLALSLFKGTGAKVVAIDSNFTSRQAARLSGLDPDVTFAKSVKGDDRFGLILLLDVMEHVDKDALFLKKIVNERLAEGGKVLITVPAFNALFSGHDRFLGHRRRYSLSALAALSGKAGLKPLSKGYLFSSLVLPRALSAVTEKAFGKRPQKAYGVGLWRRGRAVSSVVKAALDIDNTLCLTLGRLGVRIPGLTGWVLCERQR